MFLIDHYLALVHGHLTALSERRLTLNTALPTCMLYHQLQAVVIASGHSIMSLTYHTV